MSEPDIDASAVRPEYVGHERVVVRQPHRLCIPILPTKHKGNTIFLVVESFSKISEMPIHRPILSMMSLKIYPPQQSNNRLYLVVEPIPPSQAGELFLADKDIFALSITLPAVLFHLLKPHYVISFLPFALLRHLLLSYPTGILSAVLLFCL